MAEVIELIRRHRMLLDQQDRTVALGMARAWADATRALASEFEAVAAEVAMLQGAGRPVTMWHVSRLARYQALLGQIDARQRELLPGVVSEIETGQAAMVRLGLMHSQEAASALAGGVAAQFDRLAFEAVAGMVGNTGAGTPLGRLLREAWGRNAGAVGEALVRGTALGWNPVRTAQAMRQAQDRNLTRLITIARTETARVYRDVTQQQYRAAGVPGYRRVASHSPRTCMACLMMDGQWFPMDVAFQEHVLGRCTQVPSRESRVSPAAWETGEQWFARQDGATQRAMLGRGRYLAWQRGVFDLREIPVLVDDPTWGGAWQERTLRDLAG